MLPQRPHSVPPEAAHTANRRHRDSAGGAAVRQPPPTCKRRQRHRDAPAFPAGERADECRQRMRRQQQRPAGSERKPYPAAPEMQRQHPPVQKASTAHCSPIWDGGSRCGAPAESRPVPARAAVPEVPPCPTQTDRQVCRPTRRAAPSEDRRTPSAMRSMPDAGLFVRSCVRSSLRKFRHQTVRTVRQISGVPRDCHSAVRPLFPCGNRRIAIRRDQKQLLPPAGRCALCQ